ncbi:hypothetical protein ACFLTP_09765 [Chloroflexota bacterium]
MTFTVVFDKAESTTSPVQLSNYQFIIKSGCDRDNGFLYVVLYNDWRISRTIHITCMVRV